MGNCLLHGDAFRVCGLLSHWRKYRVIDEKSINGIKDDIVAKAFDVTLLGLKFALGLVVVCFSFQRLYTSFNRAQTQTENISFCALVR